MRFTDWPAAAPFVHVVLFKLPEDAPVDEARDELEHEIATLLEHVPGVESLWYGPPADTRTSKRGMVDADYDVGLLVLFRDREALDAYLKHPDHETFAEKWDDYCTVRVFDFEH